MKAVIAIDSDFDHEVVDVFLLLHSNGYTDITWLKGFDDIEWEAAELYANEVAKTLSIEYVGEDLNYFGEKING